MLERPRVSVIVLNWNGWADTLKCLRSLEKLDYPNHEIVVVDNSSTDDSVDRIGGAYPSITILQTGRNLGFAGGNNVGIDHAMKRGAEYIWLLNNDTIVDAHALSAMVNLAETNPQIGAVGSVLFNMRDEMGIQAYGGGRIYYWWGISRYFTAPVPDDSLHYITGASILLRGSLIEEIGALDEDFFMYWEDVDYSLRIRRNGWRLAVATESKVWHKEFASVGKVHTLLDTYFNASAVRFFKRHHPLPIIPIVIGVGGRLLKRIARGDLKRAKATWQSARRA